MLGRVVEAPLDRAVEAPPDRAAEASPQAGAAAAQRLVAAVREAAGPDDSLLFRLLPRAVNCQSETCQRATVMVRLDGVFAEAGGFAVLDPARLDEFYRGNSQGLDLLTRFTTTEEGDRVLEEGIVVPLLQVDMTYYRLLLHDATEPIVLQAPRLTSPGWVLGTTTGELIACGLGSLTRWDPSHTAHRRIRIEPGWYQVEVRGELLTPPEGEVEGVYEFVLTEMAEKPAFSASTSHSLSLLD